jgi:hypothetical protein
MQNAKLSFADAPPYAGYRPILSNLPIVSYVHWAVSESDAGVPLETASALSRALTAEHAAMFLRSSVSQSPANRWHSVSEGVWQFRKTSLLKRPFSACFSWKADMVRELFHDDLFPWDQRGQIALLFPKAEPIGLVDGELALRAIEQEDLRELNVLQGYLRPGDDGDFAELGTRDESATRRIRVHLLGD